MNCQDLMHALWQEHLDDFSEMPALLFEGPHCTGKRWPPVGEHTRYDELVRWSDTDLKRLGSFVIPPHTTLELRSNRQGFLQLTGMVTDTASHIKRDWHTASLEPCLPTLERDCDRRVDWDHLDQFKLKRHKTWIQYLHGKALKGSQDGTYSVRLHGRTYAPRWDDFIHRSCEEKHPGVYCACHDEFMRLQNDHPDVPLETLKVGLFVPTTAKPCLPQQHYVPSTASRALGTPEECSDVLYAQMKAGSFKGGQGLIQCARQQLPSIPEYRQLDADTARTWMWLVCALSITLLATVVVWWEIRAGPLGRVHTPALLIHHSRTVPR
jgi:hypothetical protein